MAGESVPGLHTVYRGGSGAGFGRHPVEAVHGVCLVCLYDQPAGRSLHPAGVVNRQPDAGLYFSGAVVPCSAVTPGLDKTGSLISLDDFLLVIYPLLLPEYRAIKTLNYRVITS